jgi:hypothetical protein
MDYARALTFLWEDPRWKEKLTIGTVVMLLSLALTPVLIGIVGILIVMGYGVRVLQNVRDGQQYPLPEWDQWSDDLSRGFKLAVVSLVWALPAVLLSIPIVMGGVMMGFGDENASDFLMGIGGLTFGLGYCLVFIFGLFYALVTPGFTVWYARNEQISDGLKLTEIWQWTRSNLGSVILVMLAYLVASFIISTVASIAGVLLCVIGLIVTVPLGTLATYLYQYHLIGQLAYKERTGTPFYTPAPIAPYTPYTPATPAPPVTPAAPVTPDTAAMPGVTPGSMPDSTMSDSTLSAGDTPASDQPQG